MSRGILIWLLLASIVALALRCPALRQRPMHNDEAVNAIKFRSLWENGEYRYDANEHHGPTLPYFTYVWEKLSGGKNFVDFDEASYRGLVIIFGIGLILLLPLVADGLGRNATIFSALLTAISPAMVFYSRYYIHEMLLVFFTFLALAAGWRYFQSRKTGWAVVTGIAVGLMQTTKETFVFCLAAVAFAMIVNNFWVGERATDKPGAKPILKHLAVAIGFWLIVAVVLFSSFFTNAGGPLDSIRTYLPWLNRAGGDSPHIHPWSFYLERLTFFHAKGGPIWSEGLILALALVGFVAALAGRGIADSSKGFVRFLALYTIMLTAIYCLIPYKTPWCLLGFWHGMVLLAGVGTVALFRRARRIWIKGVLAILLLVCGLQLAVQAWRASVPYAADRENPYVYAQTSPNFMELVDLVEAVAAASPEGNHTQITVMSPGSDYWPLPWYLRKFDQIGWWADLPDDPFAAMMIASPKFQTVLDEDKGHVMTGFYQLRPDAFLKLYVATNLWQTYLISRPKTQDAD